METAGPLCTRASGSQPRRAGPLHDIRFTVTTAGRTVGDLDPVCPTLPDDLIAYRRHVGDRLRTTREGAGLTQQQLAELAGLEKQAISVIENAHSSPRLDTLWRIARAMDTTVAELVNDT